MTDDALTSAADTIVTLADYFAELKTRALAIYDPAKVAARGYITPAEELQVRQLQVSYWQSRCALYELVYEVHRDVQRPERASPRQLLVALAAAAILVDAARFLRETFHGVSVVRHKLDEPDPVYGIPERMYDDVQKSLTSPYNAWHLWQAVRYYDKHRDQLRSAAADDPQEARLLGVIDRLLDRCRPSLWQYLWTRLRVRGRRTARHVGRDVMGRALYELQRAVSCGIAEVSVRPGHRPSLPPEINRQLAGLLQPGDVLVVRKQFAATNYFLPGYWPHAALFLGSADDLRGLGITDHQHVRSRLTQLAIAVPTGGDGKGGNGVPPAGRFVIEALKDGVRIRPVASPLAADSVVLVRPRLARADVAAALSQSLLHEGKPYDFDFDFCSSHRLVCTEVVYRAYEGIAGVAFDLQRHVGRFALAAGDLLRMALRRQHFELLAVYSPAHSAAIETGAAAAEIVNRVEGSQTE